LLLDEIKFTNILGTMKIDEQCFKGEDIIWFQQIFNYRLGASVEITSLFWLAL